MFLVDAWYDKAAWLVLLRPFSVVFTWLAARRRQRQQAQQVRPDVPVIIVGNIAVGGTGKTPLVLAMAELLNGQGIRTGVLSRGYGGKADCYPIQVSLDSDVAAIGDEARLLRRHLQGPMVVDPDRQRGLQVLQASGECDVVISDDGLQHYRLWRDLELAVIDATRGLGNGWCLPAGPLREPPDRLQEVDFVIINGRPGDGSIADGKLGLDTSLSNGPEISHSELVPQYWINVSTGERRALQDLSLPEGPAGSVHALAGIGNPQRFFATLDALGLKPQCHAYPDHHNYSAVELAFARDKVLLMTEKDAVKCEAFAGDQWWYLQVSARLEPGFARSFSDRVTALLASRRQQFEQIQQQQ